MANQRPIRRGRFPRWRRGRRRPVRWIDGNSNILSIAECAVDSVPIVCTPSDPRELLVGDLDIDWSDKSEVTISRIVGSITLAGNSGRSATGLLPYGVLVRLGILVTEDTDRVYNAIDLGDPESLEEFEWMWLHNQILDVRAGHTLPSTETLHETTYANVPVDIRVKRKLGKKDSLLLYGQHALHVPFPQNFLFNTEMSVQLRTVLAS